MNWEQVEGRWNQVKGAAKVQWGKLTDDDLREVDGNKDRLVGKLQSAYGLSKEEAEKQVDDFKWQ